LIKKILILSIFIVSLSAISLDVSSCNSDFFIYKVKNKSDDHEMLKFRQKNNSSGKIYFNGQINRINSENNKLEKINQDLQELLIILLVNENEDLFPEYKLYKKKKVLTCSFFKEDDNIKIKQDKEIKTFVNSVNKILMSFPREGDYQIFYINEFNEKPLLIKKIKVSKTTKKIEWFPEKDEFYNIKKSDIGLVRDKGTRKFPTKLLIIGKGSSFIVPLVYPWPYVNQLYVWSK